MLTLPSASKRTPEAAVIARLVLCRSVGDFTSRNCSAPGESELRTWKSVAVPPDAGFSGYNPSFVTEEMSARTLDAPNEYRVSRRRLANSGARSAYNAIDQSLTRVVQLAFV